MKTGGKVVNLKKVGTTGLTRYSGYVYEEFLPELRWPRAGRIYQEMADNDAVVGAILYLAEMLIRGVEWRVEPAGKSDDDKKAAEFVEQCMNDMENSWAATISEILSMMTYGFSFHEILYKVRKGRNETDRKYKSKYDDGKIGWRGFPIRAQNTLDEWEFDDEGYVTAFIQCAPPKFEHIKIPMSKGLLFRTRIAKENPEGKSLLRNAYRPWFFKKHFEEIEGIGVERDLAGFPVLTCPEDIDLWNDQDPQMVKLRADAEALVASIRRDSEEGIVMPYGWELKLLTSGSSRQIDIGPIIERYDNRIAITLLSDIILIGGNSSGSFALTDNKQSILVAALQSQIKNIADVFNTQAVPDLFKYNNWEVAEYPKITPGFIKTPSMQEVALLLRSMNLDISKDMKLQNYLRAVLNMPQLTEEEFEELYVEPAEEENNNGQQNTALPQDDSADKKFEQNDQNYTGQASKGGV